MKREFVFWVLVDGLFTCVVLNLETEVVDLWIHSGMIDAAILLWHAVICDDVATSDIVGSCVAIVVVVDINITNWDLYGDFRQLDIVCSHKVFDVLKPEMKKAR